MPSSVFWRSFGILYGAGLLCGVAILPYIAALLRAKTGNRGLIRKQLSLQYLQNAVILALSIFFGLKAAAATGLARSVTDAWRHGVSGPRVAWLECVLAGTLCAGAICLLDYFVLLPRLSGLQSALKPVTGLKNWVKILAALYGGIAEELIMRLGIFTLLAWLLQSVLHQPAPPLAVLWSVNVAVSALFAAGHLPAMAALAPLTPLVTLRILLLNFPLSLVFGFAYFHFGLEYAILTHAAASLTLQLAGGAANRRTAL